MPTQTRSLSEIYTGKKNMSDVFIMMLHNEIPATYIYLNFYFPNAQ